MSSCCIRTTNRVESVKTIEDKVNRTIDPTMILARTTVSSLLIPPLILSLLISSASGYSCGWKLPQNQQRQQSQHYNHHHAVPDQRAATRLFLAKRKRQQLDSEDLDRWYDSVDSETSPDDVFWEEMEAQRWSSAASSSSSASSLSPSPTLNSSPDMASTGSTGSASTIGSGTTIGQTRSKAINAVGLVAMNALYSGGPPLAATSSSVQQQQLQGGDGGGGGGGGNPLRQQQLMTMKSAEATLSEYAAYAVSDNWLDEELSWLMSHDDEIYREESEYKNGDSGGGGVKSLEEQLNDWEQDDDDNDDEDNAWMQSDEPWDHWGESVEAREEQNRVKIDPKKAQAYLLKEQDDDEDEAARQEEAEFLKRVSQLSISSQRLQRAKNSPKAMAFFNREPDAVEGFDRLWVSAVDNACFKNLKGTFRNYGIEFADNFGDWQDGSMGDGFYSIEDVASCKARKVYEITGLPCIASRTSFEIEPIPNLNTGGSGSNSAGPGGRPVTVNPRVASGYRFNDVGMHVDYICEALRPLSDPSRVTQFKTCLCYYDGEMEVFDYGVVEVDLVFANSLRTFIPVAQAINEMVKTLELTFGLVYQPWLQKRVEETTAAFGGASVRLRDRVLKDGRVLPNEIIDVSAFMDSKVDVELMDECAKVLSDRFFDIKATKILTVATTGLVIALPMAKYLQVPLVYARKERNIVMSDTFQAGYSSKTVGKNRELLVSKSHLDEHDRVLIVDDFLSSGSSQEALLRIVAESGATAVGIGVLLEKVYDSGRQSLSGFNIPIYSLCRVASVKGGVIQLLEEEGYDRMHQISKDPMTVE